MARPKKIKCDFFLHYAKWGKTKQILKSRMGHIGLACWWELLEILTSTEGHALDVSDAINHEYLLSRLDIDEEAFQEFIALLVRIGKIDQELWEKHKIIWCQSLVDNLEKVYSRRNTAPPEKPNPGNTPSTDKPQNGKLPAEETHDPMETAYVKLLIRGVKEAKAKQLIEKFGDEYIIQQCNVFDWMKEHKPDRVKKNPTGYLIKSIEQQYVPPAEWEEWRDQKRRRRK